MLSLPFIPLAATPTPTPSTTDPWQQFQTALNQLTSDTSAFTIRIILSLAVLLIALFGGRWLANLAGRAPVRLEGPLALTGRFSHHLKHTPETSVGPWLARLTRISVWLAAVLVLAAIWFSALGGEPTLHPKDVSDLVIGIAAHVGGSLVVVAATLGIARLFERSLEKSLQHRVNPNLALLAGRIVYVVILGVGFVVILTIWNTGIVLPVTLLGALTVALSLALQDVLKNLVSGVYLLLERPFTIGDRITLTPYTGVIEDIEIRYTALRTVDGQRVIIPNSMLFGSAVVNLTAYETRRATFTVTVPDHGADAIEKAVESIRDALESAPEVLKSPPPQIVLIRAAAGSADLRAIFWLPTESVDSRTAVFSHVLEQVRSQLEGVELSTLDAPATPV